MEIIRILAQLAQINHHAVDICKKIHGAMINCIILFVILIGIGATANMLQKEWINFYFLGFNFLIILIISINPLIILQLFGAGMIMGGLDSTKDFFQGGIDLLKLYARGMHLIIFYSSFVFFCLGAIPFSLIEKYKSIGVIATGILLLAMWPKEKKDVK